MQLKVILLSIVSILILVGSSYGQEEFVELNGPILIGKSFNITPDTGTIQWSGSDFEVFDGSSWLSLTENEENYVMDVENNKYDIETIGSQTWMTENLRTTRYNDGTEIPVVTDDMAWTTLTTAGYALYGGADTHQGYLYNFAVADAANMKNVCPVGWHVPSISELEILIQFSGGFTNAGGNLKQTGLSHWEVPNLNASNKDGFTAIPAGYRSSIDGTYHSIRESYRLWSSTFSENMAEAGWYFSLGHNSNSASIHEIDNKYGFSIRCIKD